MPWVRFSGCSLIDCVKWVSSSLIFIDKKNAISEMTTNVRVILRVVTCAGHWVLMGSDKGKHPQTVPAPRAKASTVYPQLII